MRKSGFAGGRQRDLRQLGILGPWRIDAHITLERAQFQQVLVEQGRRGMGLAWRQCSQMSYKAACGDRFATVVRDAETRKINDISI